MKKTFYLMIICLTTISQYCNSQTKSENNMIEFSKETTENEDFDRYILVKGNKLNNVESKTLEWAEIFAAGEPVNLTLKQSKLNSWTILKLPKNSFISALYYHNLVYWFLGTPPDDPNYADFTIGISIDKNGKSSYLIYNDYDLRDKIATNDDVFGVSEKNQKFILSIPFDELKPTNNKNISDFDKFLTENGIDLNEIKTDNLNWTEFQINVE